MTVAELIAILQTLPQDLPVAVNDEGNGEFHEMTGEPFLFEDFEDTDEDKIGPCVVIPVNEVGA